MMGCERLTWCRRHADSFRHSLLLGTSVLAQRERARPVLAAADAELAVQHEVRPLVQLLQRPERLREHEPIDRVPCVRYVWVSLSII